MLTGNKFLIYSDRKMTLLVNELITCKKVISGTSITLLVMKITFLSVTVSSKVGGSGQAITELKCSWQLNLKYIRCLL